MEPLLNRVENFLDLLVIDSDLGMGPGLRPFIRMDLVRVWLDRLRLFDLLRRFNIMVSHGLKGLLLELHGQLLLSYLLPIDIFFGESSE
jgi:hypothetical protein